MHEVPRTREQIQEDLDEMLQGRKRACRLCGPALFMMCDLDTPHPSNDILLIQPMRAYDPLSGYDELAVQANWKTEDPTHSARIEVLHAFVPDRNPEPADFVPITDRYDTHKSHFMVPLGWSAENQVHLLYAGLTCSHAGIILRVRSPSGPVPSGRAKLMARIWTLLAGHETARVEPGKHFAMPSIWIGGTEHILPQTLAGSQLMVQYNRIWGRMSKDADWYDVTPMCTCIEHWPSKGGPR